MLTVVLDARVGLVFVELKAVLTKTPKRGNSLGRDISTTEYSALSMEDELIPRLVEDKWLTGVITLSVVSRSCLNAGTWDPDVEKYHSFTCILTARNSNPSNLNPYSQKTNPPKPLISAK